MILHLFPILLLVTALVSIFLYQHTNHEIHLVLGVFAAIVCVLWGLAISHWSIHLISLLALIYFRPLVFNTKTVNIYNNK